MSEAPFTYQLLFSHSCGDTPEAPYGEPQPSLDAVRALLRRADAEWDAFAESNPDWDELAEGDWRGLYEGCDVVARRSDGVEYWLDEDTENGEPVWVLVGEDPPDDPD